MFPLLSFTVTGTTTVVVVVDILFCGAGAAAGF
jgi:hypothetical protein